jgi:hypothetical protein
MKWKFKTRSSYNTNMLTIADDKHCCTNDQLKELGKQLATLELIIVKSSNLTQEQFMKALK